MSYDWRERAEEAAEHAREVRQLLEAERAAHKETRRERDEYHQALGVADARADMAEERARRAEEAGREYTRRTDPLLSCGPGDDPAAGKCGECRACKWEGERRWQEIATDLARDIVPVLDCWVNGRRVRDGVMLTQREAIEAALARYEAAKRA